MDSEMCLYSLKYYIYPVAYIYKTLMDICRVQIILHTLCWQNWEDN